MPAPKNPNTAAATAAVRRRGQETMAAKLRAAGWAVTPPEQHESSHGVPIGPGMLFGNDAHGGAPCPPWCGVGGPKCASERHKSDSEATN
jgi:hypothetical protein